MSVPVDMRPSMKALLTSALALLGAGCHTVSTEVASSPAPSVRVGTRARVWELQRAGDPLGLVVLFHEEGRASNSLYLVRNLWHQDLGLVDGLGRAFRYLPHLEAPVWIGSGTVLAGAQRILEVDGACELVELDTADAVALPATASVSLAEGPRHDGEDRASAPADAPPSDEGLPQSR